MILSLNLHLLTSDLLELVSVVHLQCFFFSPKSPPRKPRRGLQREPTQTSSPCLSRRRSRSLKRWEPPSWILVPLIESLPGAGGSSAAGCENTHVLHIFLNHSTRPKAFCGSIALFIKAVCPPVSVPASVPGCGETWNCWYEIQTSSLCHQGLLDCR